MFKVEVKDAATPEEMRAELFRLRWEDTMVRAVMDAADYRGMSAEDRYTTMAYHAVRAKVTAENALLEQHALMIRPVFLADPMKPITDVMERVLKEGE